MAVELCSENSSPVMSPRISFSHDLALSETVPVEQYITSNSSSGVDFDFCVFRESFDQQSSSADELFFDGKILPIGIKKRLPVMDKKEPTLTGSGYKEEELSTQFPKDVFYFHSSVLERPAKQSDQMDINTCKLASLSVIETQGGDVSTNIPTNAIPKHPRKTKTVGTESDKKQSTTSFWRFKRSSSLNCGSGYGRSLCPLPLLSRSNSTGSATTSKRSSSLSKDNIFNKHQSQKISSVGSMKQLQSSCSNGHQKPPLKKKYGSNGVRINPVLNVPTAHLFGLGSIFSNTKEKNKKK